VRERVPLWIEDRLLADDIAAMGQFLADARSPVWTRHSNNLHALHHRPIPAVTRVTS
jgi:hypothetical protein